MKSRKTSHVRMQTGKASTLTLIKILHTGIWIMYVAVLGFILWSGITASVSVYSWVAVALVFVEVLVLAIFKWSCPLTKVARRYSDSDKENFDIYLPNWLAKYNKVIFGSLFLIGLLLLLLNNKQD